MCIYIYMYVYICIYICVCVCMCVRTRTRVRKVKEHACDRKSAREKESESFPRSFHPLTFSKRNKNWAHVFWYLYIYYTLFPEHIGSLFLRGGKKWYSRSREIKWAHVFWYLYRYSLPFPQNTLARIFFNKKKVSSCFLIPVRKRKKGVYHDMGWLRLIGSLKL